MNKAHFSRTYRSNIEKLEQRYALAAVVVADRFENNDSLSTGYDLGSLTTGGTKTYTNLTMDDIADFYKIKLTSGGTANTKVFVTLINGEGNLDLTLYSANGNLLRSSETTTNLESVSLSGLAAGTYNIKVSGKNGVQSPNYKLSLTTTGAIPTPIGPTIPVEPPVVVPPVVPPIDLVGSAITVGNMSNWGLTIPISAQVKNLGTANAGAFNVQFFISRDKFASTDDLLLFQPDGTSSIVIRGLVAGATSDIAEAEYYLPSDLPSAWTGESFFVVMKTDSAGQIKETDETNNAGKAGMSLDWEPITVEAQIPGTPIYVPSGYTIRVNVVGMTLSQTQIFKIAASQWSKVIIGDLPNEMYNGVVVDDLLIDAVGIAIDGVGGTLGQAAPDALRTTGAKLPYHGHMQFDTADLASMEADGTLLATILHEMGHVIGIGTLWTATGLLSGGGTPDPRFTGPKATTEYNTIFGKADPGVPVENSGGGGTQDAHWRESILDTELMTGFSEAPGVKEELSRITIASLADMGYVVNMLAAETYVAPGAPFAAKVSLLSPKSSLVSQMLVGPARVFYGTRLRTLGGAEFEQAENSLIGAISNATLLPKVTSNVKTSDVLRESVRTSNVRAASEVFASEVTLSSRSDSSASDLSTSLRKSSQDLFDTIFASEF